MKISYNWLKDYLKLDLPAEKVGELLTDSGLEIEGIENHEKVKGGLKGLVIGEVVSCEQHPNADRLKKTEVNVGTGELLPIVCGAPNVANGQKVVVATVGAELFPSEGDSFTIKKSKIRGEVSQGMICAEDEIGLGASHDGIMVLDASAVVGTPAAEYFDLDADSIFEIGLTPNRADAMSHLGVARDLAAVLNRFGIEHGPVEWPSVESFAPDNASNNISFEVENTEACPRYVGVTIEGIEVKESPDWLKLRLEAIGLNPINNVVDVTNFVLHEMGQPLHAFDADKIAGDKVIVKTLSEGSEFTTLDEAERKLSDRDLMICNAEEGMCIAGVFGGLKSGVSESTTRIFLESAYFNPVWVRKTAKRHGLNTDASFRFERGIDPEITVYAAKRAAMLIREVAGGEITSDIMEQYPESINGFEVELNYDRCDKLIGKSIERDLIKSIITDLKMEIREESSTGLKLYVPPFKVDVQREADLVEEILRVYGYNEVEMPEKMHISLVPAQKPDPEKIKNTALNFLADNGFNEMMANSLTKANYYVDSSVGVDILNPLSQDLDVMRESMVFSGLEAIAYNHNRNELNLRLSEFGKTYHQYESGNVENQHISLFTCGEAQAASWNRKAEPSSLYSLKGVMEALMGKLGIDLANAQIKESKHNDLEYGLQYAAQKLKIVDLGEVKFDLVKSLDIKQSVFFADIYWDNVLTLVARSKTRFADIPKFPSVKRDLALLIDKEVEFESLRKTALLSERNLLRKVDLFDVYEGKGMEDGKKSYALSFEFQDENKTLTDKVVDKSIKKIYDQLVKQHGATLRSGEL